jgi:ferredoxin-NADP reductase
VVRKLKRADLLLAYFAAAAAAVMATSAGNEVGALTNTLLYSPLLFVGFVMLTEPLTTPTLRSVRIACGVVVGVLAAPNLHIGSFYFTPEGALLIGNIVAYVLSPQRSRLELTLLRIERSAASVYDYVFGADRRLSFRPGQYLEFGLGLAHSDSRGNRRFFTIASSPAEKELRLGVKFNAAAPSAFKRALADLKPGDKIYAWQLAGDFVLPADRAEKLAFLAGGIGITPFRSQLRDLLDRRERRPIVLLYAAETSQDFAYRDVIAAAGHQLGLRVAYTVAREEAPPAGVARGVIDEAFIRREVPDFAERTFYISGPRAMVVACEAALQRLGVSPARIKVDFFPGLA